MQELQSDDFFVPAFLLKLPPQPDTGRHYTQTDDFLKDFHGWSECATPEDCED
ncbi:MAG TPA: hypothetical protein VMJ33_10025 [Gallionella sp.]|nr:hypothetical protein [Gallionella sp.]